MEVSLRLSIELDAREARSVYVSLKPDNEYPGRDLYIEDRVVERDGRGVYILEVKCRSKETCLNTVKGTIDEVLALVSVVVKIGDLLH
ncbi:hypothetical protein [Thermogladius sp.]|uniref:hypothetical protein n=1 Tax=Thermogladius sp. TaxID=2023064 RepID=UPI003D09F15C